MATTTTTDSARPTRFFVSYRRRAEVDARLAGFIVERLRAAGGEVFIDIDMPVGIEWSEEIERRILWADYLVVLLSQDSMSSEMVQAEVRRAHQAFKDGRRSKILPVRVAYTGPLGYELDGYIGRLQYALWENEGDNERVVAEVLRASTTQGSLGSEVPPGGRIEVPAAPCDRPEPKADMRLLREMLDAPGSRLSCDNPFYIRRDADQRIEEFARGGPRTLVIRGPNQTGKSGLLLRYLAKCLAAGKKIALIDLMTFGAVRKLGFPEFAARFTAVLMDELGLRNVPAPAITRSSELTHFVEDHVLPIVDGSIVVAIDEADRAIGSEWQEEFYGELRAWDANRAHLHKKASWGRVGLALAIATDLKMLEESGYASPLANVTVPITLQPFPRGALDAFNASYASMLTLAQLDRLDALLQGHPYLTQLAFYRLVCEETSFDQLVADAALEFGPFGDHLRSRLESLHNAGLIEAMRGVVLHGSVPNNDRRVFYRLDAAGLAREHAGRIVASNEVYQRFFKAVL